MIKIVTIIGARPQFIKAAAVSREIKTREGIKEIIVHTGQHFDANMSDVFFEQMDIPKPDYNLGVNSLSHGAMTGQMLEKIEGVLLKEQPEWVMVYGDTNSTIAGALAAKKLHIKVAHVEAGLRSFNIRMPEEVNRILTDRISDVLFCPTTKAVENLHAEGYKNIDCNIVQSGDVMQDAANYYRNKAVKPAAELPDNFVLATIHRAENTDYPEKMKAIFSAFEEIGNELPVVLPLHPRTRKMMEKLNIIVDKQKVVLIDPVGYLEIVWLLSHASMVMTDSGGLQKEAYFFKNVCVTIRDETEWVELVEHGFNRTTAAEKSAIIDAYQKSKDIKPDFSVELYGGGKASANIVDELSGKKA